MRSTNAVISPKLTIPDSVTFLGDSAFRECEHLQQVHFGSGPLVTFAPVENGVRAMLYDPDGVFDSFLISSAVYDDDGRMLSASLVSAERTDEKTVIDLPMDIAADQFYLKGFLMDGSSYAPLLSTEKQLWDRNPL